jgi:hypothetical protein
MMERLLARGEAIAAARVARVIDGLADAAKLPRGVQLEQLAHGVALIGRRLKWRIATSERFRAAISLASRTLP